MRDMFTGETEFVFMQERMGCKRPIVTQLKEVEKHERVYQLNRVPFGVYKDTNEEVNINFTSSKRILVLGTSGAGKTVLSSAIMDRFAKSGGSLSIFDLKGEYTQKDKPLQDKYTGVSVDKYDGEIPKYLLPGEIPQGFKIKSYYPAFMHKLTNKKLASNEKLIQFNFRSIGKMDFFTLFESFTTNNPRNFDVLEALWEDIHKEELYSWEALREFLKSDESDYDRLKKKLLSRYFKILEDNMILGDTYDSPTMIDDINDGYVSILDLQGMTNYAVVNSPVLVYVAVLLRQNYNAKVNNLISRRVHNLIMIDEINKYVPKLGAPSSKEEFLKILDLSRSERISLMYCAQDYTRIPETLINQTNYVFISYKVGLDELADLIKMLLPQEYDNPHTFKTKIAHIQGMLKKYRNGKRDWLMIDRDQKTWDIIIPCMPLTYLSEEGET